MVHNPQPATKNLDPRRSPKPDLPRPGWNRTVALLPSNFFDNVPAYQLKGPDWATANGSILKMIFVRSNSLLIYLRQIKIDSRSMPSVKLLTEQGIFVSVFFKVPGQGNQGHGFLASKVRVSAEEFVIDGYDPNLGFF